MESKFPGADNKRSRNTIQWIPEKPKLEMFVDASEEDGWNDNIVELMDTDEIQHVNYDNDYKRRKQLISLIRKKPILYDPKHPGFALKHLKILAWESIARQLNIHIDTCQDIWSELRCKYQSYVRRLQRFMSNTERVRLKAKNAKQRALQQRRRPSMRFEDEMMFLYRFIKPQFRIDRDKHRDIEAETKTADFQLAISDEDDVVLLDCAEPYVIDLDDEEYRILPYKFTNQARQLAEAVNAYPELYDTKHRNYRSVRRRGIIWSAIAAELKDKATKLMKFWILLVLRYEWEVCVGYAPEYNGGQLLKPSKLQEMLDYLRPFIKDNPNTVFKQSHYLKKDWIDPLDQFKMVVSLLDALKKNPQLVRLTDDTLNCTTKPPIYCKLWEKVAETISCTPEQCEISWLLLRNFYWELADLRNDGYNLQDKWYFEIVIGSLYKIVKSASSSILKRPIKMSKHFYKTTQQTTTAAATTTATSTITTPTLRNNCIPELNQHSRSLSKQANNITTTTAAVTTAAVTKAAITTAAVTTAAVTTAAVTTAAITTAAVTTAAVTTAAVTTAAATTTVTMQSCISMVRTTQASSIQNVPSSSTGISLSTSNDRELRLPKIVGAMSLASVCQNRPSVGTPTLIHMQPVAPTAPQSTRFAPPAGQLKNTVPIQPRLANAPVTVSVRSSQPNAGFYPFGTMCSPLLLPSGTAKSQHFFLRTVTPTPTTATATTNVNEAESNPLHLNLLRPPSLTTGTSTPIQLQTLPIMSVRPQTHTVPANEGSLVISHLANTTLTENFNAPFKSGVTIKANQNPSMFITATRKATASNIQTANHRTPAVVPTGMTNVSNATVNAMHGNLSLLLNNGKNYLVENRLAAARTKTLPKHVPTMPLTTQQLAALLSPNQIVIELISSKHSKQLIVRGPSLSQQYALSMPKTASFIREIMAIPLLHNKASHRVDQINEYWEHIAKKFDMPQNICRACWNFLADNVVHFPQVAPMSELMRPFKTSLNVWFKTHKLFRRFNSASLKRGWFKHRNELPQLLRFLEPYKFLYDDVRRNNTTEARPAQPSAEEKMIVWKKARESYPNIVHPVEIWLAFKLVFVRYMTDLEEALDNPWPENWWPALAELKYLVDARYDRLDPFYYLVSNKFDEERLRCRALDQLIRKSIENIEVPESTTPRAKTATATTKATATLNQAVLPKSLRHLFMAGAGIDAYEMTRFLCQLPAIYKNSSVQAQRPAWKKLAKRMNMTVRECRLTLQYMVRSYLKYDISDPTKYCRLNQKYYKHLAHVYRIVKTRIHNDRSKCTLIELLQQNEPPLIMQPRTFIPDINMRNCSVRLVMKNWANAASQLPNDDGLYKKMRKIFEKYKNLPTNSQQQ